MRDRIPFFFAALLVAALVSVVGVAAFSINGSEEQPQEQSFDGIVSGRVASAILAVSVSTPADEPVASTDVEAFVPEVTEAAVAPSTTAPAPSTTTAPETTTAADTTPPALVVTSPHDGDTVTNNVVEFTGTSEAGASVVSGPFAATMDSDGGWTIKLVVSRGYNSTVFTASDTAGNEGSVRVVVYYEPPATTTTTHVDPPSTTTTHPHSTTTTTHPPSTTTTTKPPSNCPVTGACSPKWPADSAGGRSRETWRSVVAKYWQADRVECVLDLIQRESNGNPQAFSGYYLGLLQHSPWGWNKRAAAAGFKDGNGLTAHPYNGTANIAAGAWLADNSSPWWKPWPPTRNIASCQALGAG